MVLSGRAQGKILLFGEHAVVHGFPALGLTLPLGTALWLSHPGDIAAHVDVPKSAMECTEQIETLVPYLDKAAKDLWQRHPWRVYIQSDVPIGRGLGSSAALTGALARAIAQGAEQPVALPTIWRTAHLAERRYHGRPSGVDTSLALGSGLLAVTPAQRGLPDVRACSASPFAMVVGTLPRGTSTRVLVQRVQDQVNAQPKRTRDILERLGHLAIVPPAPQDAGALLGERANEAHTLLQTLGLSTSALDQSLQTGLDAGAHGGKLSGAGGGGAFVLFCQDRDTAHTVRLAIDQRFQDAPVADRPQLMLFQWNGHSLSRVPDQESVSC